MIKIELTTRVGTFSAEGIPEHTIKTDGVRTLSTEDFRKEAHSLLDKALSQYLLEHWG